MDHFVKPEPGTCLVTGAASGIGAAVARVLAERGITVAAADRDVVQLRETVEKLTADGLHVEGFPVDVTSEAEVESLVDAVEQRLGPIRYLVNAAGVLRLGEVKDFSFEDWRAVFMTNTTGVFLVSRAVVKRMVPHSAGAIVTVASNAGGTPRQEMAAYGASKAAASMFTKSLGLEVSRYGIRCNVVSPGSTDTPMLRSMWQDQNGASSTIEGNPDAYRVGIPLRKLAAPSDVADAVVFLLSEHASHITLHELTVDGGAGLGR
ncbi:2,3-dihydro-2,3-dihydroxybenzoate dehydrogenase [Streptomyces tailanensis]|uniref:2,3-dihydro-2,3-dihydroxybenzoate dehydrogenase n=1 Tax=Streptomyces tailanensis TaxID=2569858 RepID=UPI00122E5EC6|nr:2,3-dihydro-2,3-dihydroxybenzoate dehydrogenase [Streptomyces tailanensis]